MGCFGKFSIFKTLQTTKITINVNFISKKISIPWLLLSVCVYVVFGSGSEVLSTTSSRNSGL